jgi:predicted nucleotidyltransferase
MSADILALSYFGSHVRGDADALSDIDILCVLDRLTPQSKHLATMFIDQHLGEGISISFYGKKRIEEMFAEGHLFAWHLFRESTPVQIADVQRDFIQSLGKPADYLLAADDSLSLLKIIESIPPALAKCDRNRIYEAGLLYLCARNVGISLSWYSPGGPVFDRFAPYRISPPLPEFPLEKCRYEKYLQARMASTRGGVTADIDTKDLYQDVEACRTWVRLSLDKIKPYETANLC